MAASMAPDTKVEGHDNEASTHSKNAEPFIALGFGIPLQDSVEKRYMAAALKQLASPSFPNAVEDWGGRPLTIREKNMVTLLSELTEKANRETKIRDKRIVAKWRSEAVKEGGVGFSDIMFDYVSSWQSTPSFLEKMLTMYAVHQRASSHRQARLYSRLHPSD